ncbi:MAG: VWA domain-containing protein [Candidatus Woesearchaeota archaeon]|nr:VWA domain-containing protein [Candidatus Woesearchaeota archaeon]
MVSVTFTNPEYLWFLVMLPVLVAAHFFILRHTKRKALKFANFVVLKRATGQKYITKNYTILVLRLCIVLCAVLAVSQTIIWYEGETNENEYVIALDTSASMAAKDFQPTRMAAAISYAKEFVEVLDRNTRVGLVSFSGVTFIEQPLTNDKKDLRDSLDDFEISAAGTDIPGATITSTNLLINAEKGRAVILITDGSNTIETFHSKSLQRATQYAKINRVKIHTIGVGTDTNAPIGYLPTYYNVSATYNDENLQYISNATGGDHYRAFSEEELAAAYKDIQSAEKTSTLKLDTTPGLMLITLILILVEWILLSTRFRMLP